MDVHIREYLMKQITMIKYVLQTVIVTSLIVRHKMSINNHIKIQIFVFLNVKINCIIDTIIIIAGIITMNTIFVVMIMNKKDVIAEQQVHQFIKCTIHITARIAVV